MLLRLDGVRRAFAGLVAVDGVGFDVAEASVHALIGPNGAGKTTLFNIVSGLIPADAGRIEFAGRDITRAPAHRRAALGLGRTFQNIRLFGEMTVLENVVTGMHPRLDVAWPLALLRSAGARAEERRALDRARELLAFVGIAERAGQVAADLAYGDQRRLEIARALAAEPALLLLDEPAAGMNPTETAALAALIRRVRDRGTAVLVVEHNIHFVMDLCDRVTVLNFGRKIAEGSPAEVRADAAVVEAYLGGERAAPARAEAGR